MVKRIFLIFLCLSFFTPFAHSRSIKKVVSLAPNITEIIYFLGVQDKLVGVTTACNYPKEVRDRVKNEELGIVGEYGKVNVEKIVSLKPNLILTANFPEYLLAKLKPLNYRVLNYKMETIEALLDSMESIAKELQGDVSKVEGLRKRVAPKSPKGDLKKAESSPFRGLGGGRTRVLVLIWDKPLMAAGGKSFLNEIIELAGGKNVFAHISQDYPKVNYEQIVAAKPDLIVFTQKVSGLEKFKNYKVYTNLNPDILLRPGPRLLTQGLDKMKEIIHSHEKN